MENDFGVYDEVAVDYEKLSYGKRTYKRVQRLRNKGKRRGIEVPRLGYELNKPEKPRIPFWVAAIVSAVIFIGILVGIGFLYNELVKLFTDLGSIGELIANMFKPEALGVSLGLSAIPGILFVLIYIMLIIILLLPLIPVVYFYRLVRDAFYMAKCSQEEFAKGNLISNRIFGLTAVLIGATVLLIVLLVYITSQTARLYIGLIYGGILLTLGGLLVIIVLEKIKAKKQFDALDEFKKQNYLAHERGLRSVKRRIRFERRAWNDMFNK